MAHYTVADMTINVWMHQIRFAVLKIYYSIVVIVDLVSDPLTQPHTPSRGAEPSSASVVSAMLDPAAWNSLPRHLHQINDTSLFKRRLKTELFRRAYHC